jgi:hypothetical protein
MDCCDKLTPDFTGEPEPINGHKTIGRRAALKRLAGLASGIMFVSKRNAYGQGRQVLLAFCGQLLCVIPYEVARARGHFADEGLDVRLVYTRGGNVAMQALVGHAVDYAGTSFDVALKRTRMAPRFPASLLPEDCRSLRSQARRKRRKKFVVSKTWRVVPSESRLWATRITFWLSI